MHWQSFSLAILLQAAVDIQEAQSYLLAVLGISGLSLLAAFLLARYVISQDAGTLQMQKISNAIRSGAEAFLRRQNRTILWLAAALAIVIFVGYSRSAGGTILAWRMTVAFVAGAVCSTAAGFSGMWVSIRSNIRVASAARFSLNKALQIALRGGAVTGLSVVALSLLGVGLLFWMFGGLENPQRAPGQIIAFGFGASFVALFAQLGDNAKKYIETGANGGKGPEAHKASVVGDTVGHPFKDTAGPSLQVLIKLPSTITLVAAPLFP